MNIRTDLRLTKEQFLRWTERQEFRHEYAGGRVVMMVQVSRNHGMITANLLVLLRGLLPVERWNVFADALAVEVGTSIRFPDFIVEPAGGDGNSRFSEAPVFLAEVLSPSSLETDLHQKAEEYTSLPSLQAYAVLAQDEPRLWLWQRGEDGTFAHAAEMIEGVNALLPLPALAAELRLADIYRGVG